MELYTTLRSNPGAWGHSLAQEFWYGEPRTLTDLVFQCPDGFVRCHKLLLRTCCRTVALAIEAAFDSNDEDLILVLPDISVQTVRRFIELFYTGYAAFADQQELVEFQNFVHGQLRFNGRYAINDVFQDYPESVYETGNGQDLDAVKLLGHLAPVRNASYLNPGPGGDHVKIESDDVDYRSRANVSGNLQSLPTEPIDDSDIPGLVSNFLEESEVFSPETGAGQPADLMDLDAQARNRRKAQLVKKLGSVPSKLKPMEGRPRFCHLCDKQFYFEEPFQIHLKSVHRDGAQPVEVPIYPGMKLTIAQQVISMKVWTEEFPQPIVDPNDNTNLMCPNCRRSTKTKQSYKNHHMNNKKHGRCRGYELPTKPPKIVRDGRNYCGHPECLDPITGDLRPDAEGWPDTMAIYRHFQEVHAKDTDLTFKCDLCDKAFLTQGLLSSHKGHHQKPPCKYCGVKLTPKALKIHELNHEGAKPYSCEFCDFRSASKASIKNHKLSRHTSESERPKNHICDVENCGKAFSTKDKLRSHKRSHSDFREFLCSVCGTAVKNKEYLAKHLIIHGIKFECHICGKVCTSQKSLDIHKREKHGMIKEWSMPQQQQQQQQHLQQQLMQQQQPDLIEVDHQIHLVQQASASKQLHPIPMDIYMTVKDEYQHHQ